MSAEDKTMLQETDDVAKTKIGYWEEYYARAENAPDKPSTFAMYCQKLFADAPVSKETDGGVLLEVGCGNGRDAFFFANSDIATVGCDITPQGIAKLAATSHEKDGSAKTGKPRFIVGNFCNFSDDFLGGTPVRFVYSRFTLHAVRKVGADNFLSWAARNMVDGGILAIEARSIKDPLCGQGEAVADEPDAYLGVTKHAAAHFRRFIRHQDLIDQLKGLGFELVAEQESNGLSVHGADDPVLSRVVVKKVGAAK